MKSPERPFFYTEKENHSENVVEVSDALIEAVIEQSYYVNSGNNGVIHAISTETMTALAGEDVFRSMEANNEQKSFALKMLKIYEEGVGEAEFAMQKKAHDLIAQQPDMDNYARIPQPIFCKSVHIASEVLQQQLKNEGIASPETISLICMDYIDGEDFAMHLYKKIIMRSENTTAQELSDISFTDLQTRVAHILGFHVAKQRNNPVAEEMIARENAKKIVPFLKRTQDHGVSLQPAFVEKIRNTIQLLHKNGIYHRDLHERNIMLLRDTQTGLCDESIPYMIDFGASRSFDAGASMEDIYTQDGHRLVDDSMIVGTYESLTLSKDEVKEKNVSDLENTLNRIAKRLEKQEVWRVFISKPMSDDVALLDIERLVMGVNVSSLETQFYIKLIALREIAKKSPENAMTIYDNLLHSVQKQPFFYNLAQNAQSVIFLKE